MRVLGLALLACLLCGCENAEEKARYVKAPLDGVDTRDRVALNQAVSEAKTRLVSVRDDELRAELARDIEDVYERSMAAAREAEQQEAARRAQELEKERQTAREREARAREVERQREAKRKPPPAPDSEPDQDSLRRAALAEQRRRHKAGVTSLEVGIRPSALGDGTKVLVLRNAKDYPVDFNLRCRTVDDSFRKTFPMSVPARGEKHLGFVQGWCGNFRGGERCAAYVDDERMWEYDVP